MQLTPNPFYHPGTVCAGNAHPTQTVKWLYFYIGVVVWLKNQSAQKPISSFPFLMPEYQPQWQYRVGRYWGDCHQDISEWLDTIPETETKAIFPCQYRPDQLRWTYNMQKKTQTREERGSKEEEWKVVKVRQMRRILIPCSYSPEADDVMSDV